MHPSVLALSVLALASVLAACVPPREHVDGRSADGGTAVELDLHSAAGDSVLGSGTIRVAGHPRAVVLHGQWSDKGDGIRQLAATLQADTMPAEQWTLEWSPVSLNGSLRHSDAGETASEVALASR